MGDLETTSKSCCLWDMQDAELKKTSLHGLYIVCHVVGTSSTNFHAYRSMKPGVAVSLKDMSNLERCSFVTVLTSIGAGEQF